MALTYSTGQGVTYTEKRADFTSVLNLLPDNTQKLISPRDVRDSLFTIWENIPLKSTKVTTSDEEYIGMDNSLILQKIYFGKKRVGNLEIMDNNLLINDVDFYFYNNKKEPEINYNTKIAILAGTGGFFKEGSLSSPYLESRLVQLLTDSYVNLEISNSSFVRDGNDRIGGDININSEFGRISLNGLILPTQEEMRSSNNDGKLLQFTWDGFSNGYLTFSSVESGNISEIFSENTVTITGNDVKLVGDVFINDESVNFTDSTPTPIQIGGVLQGTTFDNASVTSILRQLLYPYIKPTIPTFTYSIELIESGDSATADLQKLTYKIVRSATFSITSLIIPNLASNSPAIIDPTTIPQNSAGVTSEVKPAFNVFLPKTTSNSTVTTIMTLTDQTLTTVTAQASFSICLPWYYGTCTTAASAVGAINLLLGTQTPQPNLLTAILKNSQTSTTAILTTTNLSGGVGCIYFGYPASFGDLTSIEDQNGYPIIGEFTQYILTGVKSPQQYWGGGSEERQYKFYILTRGTGEPVTTIVPLGAKYKFNF